jgi:outer membrane protein OmpA-like peptidoglycan-associated protein
MTLRGALLVLTALAIPTIVSTAARAQPFSGLYIGVGGGFNSLGTEDVKPSPGLATPRGKAKFGAGYLGLGSIGWGFGNGIRVELEGNYRHNDLSRLTGTSYPSTASGTQEAYGAMANALFDLDIGSPYIFPYVGVGAGWGWTHWKDVTTVGANTPVTLSGGGTYGAFAYQTMAGISLPVPNVPGLSLTAEYRFYGVPGTQQVSGTLVNHGVVARGNLDFKNDYENRVTLGLRYAFFVAPPEPPPMPTASPSPAPAPARSYLVFFDWDRADLTDRARQIVAEAAQASTRVRYTRIAVNGYTDTSGRPAYNQTLSLRRAHVVAAELTKDGVPGNVITITGFGETHLLVPTAAGVREPQNRRVEIILQ